MQAAERVGGVQYHEPAGSLPGIRATFRRAGHILGAASIALDLDGEGAARRVVFSGDLGRYGVPVPPRPGAAGRSRLRVRGIDLRGPASRPRARGRPARARVRAAVDRGGALVVPAFAVGRTQELIYHLRALEDAGRIPKLPTFVDSPMAIEATGPLLRPPRGPRPGYGPARPLGDVPAPHGPVQADALGGGVTGHQRRPRAPRSSSPRAAWRPAGASCTISAAACRTRRPPSCSSASRRPGPAAGCSRTAPARCASSGRTCRCARASRRSTGSPPTPTATACSAGSGRRPAAPRRVFVVHGDPGPAETLAGRIRAELGWDAVVPDYRERVTLD